MKTKISNNLFFTIKADVMRLKTSLLFSCTHSVMMKIFVNTLIAIGIFPIIIHWKNEMEKLSVNVGSFKSCSHCEYEFIGYKYF